MKRIWCLLLVCLFPLLCVGQGVITRQSKTPAPPKQIKRQSKTDKSSDSNKSDKKDNKKASSKPSPKPAENKGNKTDAAKEASKPQDKLEKSKASTDPENSNKKAEGKSANGNYRKENDNVGSGRNSGNSDKIEDNKRVENPRGNAGEVKKEKSQVPVIKEVTITGLTYKGSDQKPNEVSLIKADKNLREVIIPSSILIDGYSYTVVSIGEKVFYEFKDLTSVTIPNSITSIGKWAFLGCEGINKVEISDLEAWCKIKFTDSWSNPLNYAHSLYLNGKEIKDLVIPNSVTSIGADAFYGCSGLTSITIPSSVTSIGSWAFYKCSGLKK